MIMKNFKFFSFFFPVTLSVTQGPYRPSYRVAMLGFAGIFSYTQEEAAPLIQRSPIFLQSLNASLMDIWKFPFLPVFPSSSPLSAGVHLGGHHELEVVPQRSPSGLVQVVFLGKRVSLQLETVSFTNRLGDAVKLKNSWVRWRTMSWVGGLRSMYGIIANPTHSSSLNC